MDSNLFPNLNDWIKKNLKLIRIEHEEEVQQNEDLLNNNTLDDLEKAGHAITKMFSIRSKEKSIVLELPKEKSETLDLKKSPLLRGFVGITIDNETIPIATGIVKSIETKSLELYCENFKKLEKHKEFNLVKVVNSVTYNRIKFTLDALNSRLPENYLLGLLFGMNPLTKPSLKLKPYYSDVPFSSFGSKIFWFNKKLNDRQKFAIENALFQQHIAVIHGPPGTGKTTTLAELILQLIMRGYRILVCAPSNVAVDNIFKQMLKSYKDNFCSVFGSKYNRFSFIRIGHSIRVDQDVRKYLLPTSFDNDDYFKEKLRGAHVIMSTLTSAFVYNKPLSFLYDDISEFSFDVVIIDECAQATEPAAWIPLSFANKCIIAGDHKQLPPTIFSQEAANKGLKVSLLERVDNIFHDQVVRMLTLQHRMNELIMKWPSDYFYNSQLRASAKVAHHQIKLKLGKVLPEIKVIDTSFCGMEEFQPGNSVFRSSKCNVHEAKIVCLIIQQLIQDGVNASDIGVITPYRLQTILIQSGCMQYLKNASKKIEIHSVDGFQGREKEVIILSMVRSNKSKEIGFLREERRLNVAITRARKHLVVIGDSNTVTFQSYALTSFYRYCFQHSDWKDASIYKDQINKMVIFDRVFQNFVPKNTNKNISQENDCEILRRAFINLNINDNKQRNQQKPKSKSSKKTGRRSMKKRNGNVPTSNQQLTNSNSDTVNMKPFELLRNKKKILELFENFVRGTEKKFVIPHFPNISYLMMERCYQLNLRFIISYNSDRLPMFVVLR